MTHSLFDSDHLKHYTFYGTLAAIFFSITGWFFLYDAAYTQTWLIYVGSALFMFVIMLFAVKLYNLDEGKGNSKNIVYAGHLTVVVGVVVSIIFCLFLTHNYTGNLLSAQHAALPASQKDQGEVFQLFLPGLLVNFLAGSFVSFMIGYASKWNRHESKVAGDLY